MTAKEDRRGARHSGVDVPSVLRRSAGGSGQAARAVPRQGQGRHLQEQGFGADAAPTPADPSGPPERQRDDSDASGKLSRSSRELSERSCRRTLLPSTSAGRSERLPGWSRRAGKTPSPRCVFLTWPSPSSLQSKDRDRKTAIRS